MNATLAGLKKSASEYRGLWFTSLACWSVFAALFTFWPVDPEAWQLVEGPRALFGLVLAISPRNQKERSRRAVTESTMTTIRAPARSRTISAPE